MSNRRSLFIALVTAPLAMLAITMAAAPAQAAGPTPINAWNKNNCLDNATENASKIQMWSCTGGSEQKWLEGSGTQTSLFTFTNSHTRWCITAPAVGAGTVTMAPCDAAATTQQWRVFFADNPLGPPSGWYDVWQNAASGLCLETPSLRNGTVLQTAPCDASNLLQRWHQQ
jgi:Ricin-type beta-trefoil lectin domain